MTGICPYCGRPPPGNADDLIETRISQMRAWLADGGFVVRFDGTINEAAAAALLDRSPHTLRGWRSTDGRLPYRRTKAGVRYALTSILDYLDEMSD